jgi:glucosamine 6-phosphate synthetase-like amidotransferase/phosphosugar isomerase protein
MCGLIAFYGTGNSATTEVFEQLLVESIPRGIHSTGYAVRCGNTSILQKKDLPANKFVEEGYTMPLRRCGDYNMVIGHVRHATVGSINQRVAHPFGVSYRDTWIFGVHNGTIENYKEIMRPEVPNNSDSEAMIQTIIREKESKNLKWSSAIKRIASKMKGGFAFILMDTTTDRLFFFRNYGRPLELVRVDCGEKGVKGFFLISEAKFFKTVAERVGIPETDYTIKNVPSFHIYKMDKKDGVKKIGDFTSPISKSYNTGWEKWAKYYNELNKPKQGKKKKVKKSWKVKHTDGIIDLSDNMPNVELYQDIYAIIGGMGNEFLLEDAVYMMGEYINPDGYANDMDYLYSYICIAQKEVKRRNLWKRFVEMTLSEYGALI